MIRPAALLLVIPVLIAALIAVPLGLWVSPYQLLCAGVAVALIVPPSVATFVVAKRMAKTSAYGQVAGLFLGTFVRLAVGFGGAVLVFVLSKPTFHSDPISYLLWILGLYLTVLVIETVLLAQNSPGRMA